MLSTSGDWKVSMHQFGSMVVCKEIKLTLDLYIKFVLLTFFYLLKFYFNHVFAGTLK